MRATDYPTGELRTGTFQYKGQVYHVDAAGNLYQWHSHDDLGGFFSKIGKVLQKVNAAPLKLVQKVASLTPITKKLAEKDILLKLEAKRVEFENKHIYDPAQAKKDIKKVAPYVAAAVATYFGFGSVAAAALQAYNQRKAKLEAMKAQAAADADAQRLIDQQIAQADAEIARLNSSNASASEDQKRMDALVLEWNKYNDLLGTDKNPANASMYNTKLTAIENEMLALSNKAKQLPTITMPDANPAIAIKPAPIVAAQAEGWHPIPLSAGTTAPSAGLLPMPFQAPAVPQVSPAYTPSPMPMQPAMQTSPAATEAVQAYFTRTGVETGPGVVDVTKPDAGKPAPASDASKWIKPLLIGGAALVSLAN